MSYNGKFKRMAGLTNAQNGRIVNMKFGQNEVKDVDDHPSSVAGKPRERMALCALSASFRL